jgi:hypothetical protein
MSQKIKDFIKEIEKYETAEEFIKDYKPKDVLKVIKDLNKDADNNKSRQGFIYERLWDICIKFGITDLTDKDTKHGRGNMNIKVDLDKIEKFFDTYIEEGIISGNSGGYSDITFENNNILKKTLNLVSVKYIKGKSITDFDIQNLCTIIKDREKEYRNKNKNDIDMENYEIKTLLFVKNKEDFIELCKKANKSSNLLIKYISPNGNYENVYDLITLEVYYKELKKLLHKDLYNYWKDEQYIKKFKEGYLKFKNKIKPAFSARFHQELFIEKINAMINRFSKNENKQILVGAIPRSGKTYIMAGTILRHVKEHTKKELKSGAMKKTFNNYVIITPSPNETLKQYKDAFDGYIDFKEYNIEADIIRAENSLVFDKNKDKHFVYLISKQRLENIKDDDPDNSKYEKKGDIRAKKYEDNIKKYFGEKDNIKIIFMDEAHFGMSTEIAQKIVNCLKTSNSIKIFVTATYNKPQSTYGINDKYLIKWDLDDIKLLKEMSTEGLEKGEVIKDFRKVLDQFSKKFGVNILNKVLKNNGWDWYGITHNELSSKVITKVLNRNKTIIDNIRKQYRYFPEPYMITSVWDDEFFEEQKKLLSGKETNYGFDMEKLFQLKPDNNVSFVNNEQLTQLFQYYFGYPDKKKSYYIQNQYKLIGILPRIERICNNNCRTLQTPLHKTTQLWFLPPDNIAKTINALLYFLIKEFEYIFKKYKFYIGVLEVEEDKFPEHPNVKYMEDPQNIKSEIYDVEQNIKENDDYDGLIILVGKRLQLGISLENVDIVSLFTNIKASDAIYQMIFRSMTEIDDGMKCNGSSFCSNKKYGFMVDLDPQRTIYTLEYLADRTSSSNDDDDDETYRKSRIADLINIDKDKFVNKYDTAVDNKEYVKEFFDKLYHSWEAKTENIKNILKNENILDNSNIKELLKVDISSLFNYEKDKSNGKKGGIIPKNAILSGKILEFKDLFKKQGKKRAKTKADTEETEKNKDTEMLLYDIISETISILTFISSYSNLECIFSKDKIKDFKYEILKIFDELNDDEELKDMYIYYLKKRIVRKEAIIAIADEKITEFNDKLFEKVYEIIKSINKKQNNLNGQSGGHIGINKLIHMRKEKIYNIKEPRKLLEFINENLAPKETEKKDRGEVFTPIEIVNEMLDALPKEVWVNTKLKWLDPAAGMGNFPVAVYTKLMDGLILQIPNEDERRKHILEEMLYMVEYDKANVFMMKKIFCSTTYKLNIFEGSFIEGDDYTDKGVDMYGSNIKLINENNKKFIDKVKRFDNKFNIIMGNPPYNKDGAGKGGGVFWKSFVYKSLEILRNDGYILMIHPTGWRKPVSMRASAGDIWEIFKKYNLIFLKITDEKIPNFPKVDYYVLKKSNIQQNTKVINQFEKNPSTTSLVNLYNLPFIPHLINDEVISIMNKLLKKKGEKFNIKRNQTIKPKKGIRNISGIPHAHYFDINTRKYQEIFDKYKNEPDDYISTPKIIMTYSGGKKPANLYAKYFSKEIGITDNTMYQVITKADNINNIITFLNSKLIHFILKITQYSSAPNYKNEFNILNMFAKPNEETITTDEDVFNYYKLNKNECSLINKIIGEHKGANSLPLKKQKVVKIRNKSLGGKYIYKKRVSLAKHV